MKKLLIASIVVIMIACLVLGSTLASSASGSSMSNPAPTVTVLNPVVMIDKKAEVGIIGSGFESGQELYIMITESKMGTKANLENLNPVPKANERGAWGTVWTGAGKFCSKDMLAPGEYVIYVTDTGNNLLATAPIVFYDAEQDREEWPTVANFMYPEE